MLGPAGKSSKLTLKKVRLHDECKIAWNVYLSILLFICLHFLSSQLIEGNARQLPVVWRHNRQLGVHEIIISYQKPTFTLHSGVIPFPLPATELSHIWTVGTGNLEYFNLAWLWAIKLNKEIVIFLWNHRAIEYMEKSSLFTPIYNCLQHCNHVTLLQLWDSRGYERLLLKMKMCLE